MTRKIGIFLDRNSISGTLYVCSASKERVYHTRMCSVTILVLTQYYLLLDLPDLVYIVDLKYANIFDFSSIKNTSDDYINSVS